MNLDVFKIKKCKKQNCSEVRIYESDSDLVKEYNKKIKQESPKVKKPEVTELEKRNILYKKSINEIYSKVIIDNHRKYQQIKNPNLVVEILKTIVFKKHRKQKLFKTSVNTLFHKIKNLDVFELNQIKENLI